LPKLTPIKNSEFISRLKQFGFEGPYAGGKHLYMIKGNLRLTIPNPHKKEIGVDLLRRISKTGWNYLKRMDGKALILLLNLMTYLNQNQHLHHPIDDLLLILKVTNNTANY